MPLSLGLLWLGLPLAASLSGKLPVSSAPVWIDGGRRLAFIADDGLGPLWYSTPADGGEPEPLFPEPRYESAELAWWSPNGEYLAFIARDDGDRMLYVWRYGGEAARIVAPIGNYGEPAVGWGRDSRRLAVCRRTMPESPLPYEVITVGVGLALPVIHVFMSAPVEQLVWSPDLSRLAYVSETGGAKHLMVALLAERRAVICSPYLPVIPGSLAWTPNSRRVTFVRGDRPAQGGPLYAVRSDGRLPAEPLDLTGYVGSEPILFCPGGVWAVWRTGSRSNIRQADVTLAPANDLAAGRKLLRAYQASDDPVFNADGSRLACCAVDSWQPLRTSLVVVDPYRPEEPHTVAFEEPLSKPVFGPDGTKIALLVGPPEARRVVVVPAQPPVPEREPPRPAT